MIRDVSEGVAKIVGDLEKTLKKLVDPKVLKSSHIIERLKVFLVDPR